MQTPPIFHSRALVCVPKSIRKEIMLVKYGVFGPVCGGATARSIITKA